MDAEAKLYYTLEGVMHSVDKWLDGDELKQDEVNRAATMREKTLQIVERLQAENKRLTRDNTDLRNFACNLCGRYKEAHNGACDGCRWKKGE